ncbi:hypothetical protein ACFY7C_25055 [Streptomyces sp. NPDC012769]|uniref:hypothetical protein n=1 Tax=Streptomyces sp. NPDC012769 TaxID=3364848 RepID=UPI00368C1C30
MIRAKHIVLGATSAVLLGSLVGCGGGGAEAGGSLSVDRLVQVAEEVGRDGADTCPLPYDTGKAAEAAKVDASVEPGTADAEPNEPTATAEGGKTTDPQSAFAGKGGAWITCSYHVGGDDLVVHTVGTEAGNAVNVLLPTTQQAAGMSADEVKAYYEKADKAKPGEAVPSPGGNVVTVSLDSGGKGDVALLLTVGEDDKSALKPEQVLQLARTFAAQAE